MGGSAREMNRSLCSVVMLLLLLLMVVVGCRPEVRNCAINTLFSCVVGHGISFPMVSWRARIDAILALIQVRRTSR